MEEGSFIHFSDSSYSRDIMISQKTRQELEVETKMQKPLTYFWVRPDGLKKARQANH